ncbi:hypothetical protein D3C71_1967870 [compost metagenome]
MLRQFLKRDHRRAREIRHVGEARNIGDMRPRAHIDENLRGGVALPFHGYRLRGDEFGVAIDHIHRLETVEPSRQTASRV